MMWVQDGGAPLVEHAHELSGGLGCVLRHEEDLTAASCANQRLNAGSE